MKSFSQSTSRISTLVTTRATTILAIRNRFFFRSDHYNYAKKGIPIIFFFDGVHEDYHRPGDSADKIDYEKMEKITRTVYMTLWEIANRATRPKVDKPLAGATEHKLSSTAFSNQLAISFGA